MIDWAQLAQSNDECQHEAQIIRRNDGEMLLMKYGHELCYIVLNKPRFSSSRCYFLHRSNYTKQMRLSVYFELDDASPLTSS